MSEYVDLHGDIPGGMSEQTINQRLRTYFDGRIVRKDLTKAIKAGAHVPVYVLEFLL